MWKKIQVYKTPISQYAHEGFIIEYKRHRITNLVKNYSVSLPFKLFPVINLYSYELMFTTNYLILNMMVNLDELHHKLDNYSKIPHKNDLFHMLQYIHSVKLPKTTPSFRRLKNPLKIIEKYEIIPYHHSDTLEINNLLFNLTTEVISKVTHNLNIFCLDIFFIFCYKLELLKYNNVCIIDDSSQYTEDYNVITKNNYKNITKSFFNNNIIIIDKDFFVSKIYTSGYKDFHSDPSSIYAFDNYKLHVSHGGDNSNVFNVELFNSFTIILNDISLDKIYDHPVKYTTQKTLFVYSGISTDIITTSTNYINSYYATKFKNLIETGDFMNRIFFLPENLYNYKKTISEIKCKLCPLHDIDVEYKFITSIDHSICSINCCPILNTSHYKFSCDHKFIIERLSDFIDNYPSCPICLKPIDRIQSIVNKTTIITDLIGEEFYKVYSLRNNYYIIGLTDARLISFISSNITNISFITDCQLNIVHPAVLCFIDSYSYLDILNFMKDIDTNLIDSIFKISQSI